MDYAPDERQYLRPSDILELSYNQKEVAFDMLSPVCSLTVSPGETMECSPLSSNGDHNLLLNGDDTFSKEVAASCDPDSNEFYAIYHMLQSVYSPQIALIAPAYTNFDEYISSVAEDIDVKKSTHGMKKPLIYPLRKDPRLVKVNNRSKVFGNKSKVPQHTSGTSNKPNVTIVEQANKGSERCRVVVFHFQERKELFQTIALSGPAKEYQLPVFQSLAPFRVLRSSKEYQTSTEITDSHVEVVKASGFNEVAIKRYESRLTVAQTAIILGLQDYKTSLTKHIETTVLLMLEQLCGFKIGNQTWSRGTLKPQRKEMISKVTKFVKVYFPMLTAELVEIIIKRGCYARTQMILRSKRSRKRRVPV